MERMDESLIKKKHLIDEHYARYKLFLNLVEGNVVDCACGIGYASEVVLDNSNANSYLGIDVSKESIEIANSKYKKENVSFNVGSLVNLDIEDDYADAFFCMETLEHIQRDLLDKCCSEIVRVLKPNGIFIGSVPTCEYDDKCESVYGVNSYHITRFSQKSLESLLKKHFKFVKVGIITRQVASFFVSDQNLKDRVEVEIFNTNENSKFGSFMFLCSNDSDFIEIESKAFFSQTLVEYDEEQVIPLYESMRYAEKMALDRLKFIREIEEVSNERLRLIRETEEISNERLDRIKHLEQINKKYSIIFWPIRFLSKIFEYVFKRK